jgi:hypothetical protein
LTSPKICKKYGFEEIEKMNNFLHRNFFQIWNENLGKSLGLEFDRI